MELIPNLPDEIAADCLVRVPYISHCKLKSVSRSWRCLVNNPWFYQQRKATRTSEECIFMLQALPHQEGEPCANKAKPHKGALDYGITAYDPIRGACATLPPIPQFPTSIPLFSQCVSVREKLIVIGGWHPSTMRAVTCVFCYDVLTGRWARGADMPTRRSFFACCVSDQGIVYIAGGHDEEKNAVNTVEAYDLEKDAWESVPPMSKARDECGGFCMDGKLVVISGYETQSQGRFLSSGEVFNPRTRSWSWVENIWKIGRCPRSCVHSVGGLYSFCNQRVMRFNEKENVWVEEGSMPQGITVTCCATMGGGKIFVSGCDSNKVMCCYMYDTENGKWVEMERPKEFGGLVHCTSILEL
ncbi:hypothetical protein SUGI_0000720 [Cryptomeria japonica]|uniref:F-box/kelch-repeat protein SKIP20-like n=1 Tax=Cryptomeria japonica TaxID=3369 RepID=UPI002408B7A0|nr:F-box/kelch-repeat protein SKIP20-like [Cryptomeria japonica]GLJ04655.1 hypothetical protein SUGI_0000720 [Cryptomeria japonica]